MEKFSFSTLSAWTSRKRSKQCLCFIFALGVHIAFFATISIADPYGALGEGEGGLEVGLGLLTPYLPESDDVEPESLQQEFIQPIVEVQPPIPEIHTPEMLLEEIHFQIQRPIIAREPIEIDRSWESITIEEPTNRMSSEASFGSGSQKTYGGTQGARSSYVALVAARLNKFKRYPSQAKQEAQQGEVLLSLVIERSGTVRSAQIEESSGFELLDEAVVSMVQRAEPFPAFPEQLRQSTIRFVMPVTFTIEED